MLESRHIQNFTDASKLEPHWGYADRVVPCTNDAGSCAYLDTVYWAHDIGMIYTGIMWVAIIGVLMLWGIWYRARIRSRLSDTVEAVANRWLLTDFRATRSLFGRATKLQLVVLGAIAAYLFIFSFAGFTYQTWVTPVKGMPGTYNTRTSLGPWSDRVGVLAFALTPLSILLASRESLLSVITGLPYHHFNFLHRWLGHIILAQSMLHTIGWCIIELRLYQPQPSVGIQWITQTYMIWGIVAMLLLLILWGLALPVSQRLFGYEFFRKAHYVLAALYMGACIGHWQQLQCFIIPGLLLWATDRAIRLFRTALIHYRVLPNGRGIFQSIDAKITHFDGEVVRLDFEAQADWQIGQHFFICFAKGGIWQSHPFTPLSLPGATQSYVFRAKKGETKRVVQQSTDTTPVILTGPYGADIMRDVEDETNVLCVAGGTGISFVLPVLLDLARREHTAQVKLIWAVRHANDAEWIERELAVLRDSRVEVVVCPTRDATGQSTPTATLADMPSPASPDESAEKTLAYAETGSVDKPHHRPDIRAMVRDFVVATETTRTAVFVSGPASLTSSVREEVARCNDPVKVWKGVREPVSLVHDERLE